MAPVPASLTVNFTAQTIGTHRVCYRTATSGPYTCVTTECGSIGPCSAILPIYVDDQTCTAVTYYVYIQAACEDPTSNQGRLAINYTFTPSPACKAYTLVCDSLPISAINVLVAGSGYVSTPLVSIVGPGGAATADALVGQGAILSTLTLNPGTGYNDGTYGAVPFTNGSGMNGAASVVVSGGVVTSVVITNAGVSYLDSDPLSLDATLMGGSTPSVAVLLRPTTDFRTIKSIYNIVTTIPFTSTPSVVITGGGGINATAQAVLAPCPAITLVGCSGDSVSIPSATLTQGESVVVCDFSSPTVNPAYGVSQSGNCLCSCITATIGVSGTNGAQARYYYNKCNGAPATGILTVNGSPSSVVDCIVPGSLVFEIITLGASGTVSYGASCS